MILDRFRLDGKVAIVTGASTGLGQGMAIGLAEAGADIVGVGSQRSFDQTQTAIEKLGRRFVSVKTDLAKLNSVPVIVNRTLDCLGRIDILVNNAAGQRRKGALEFTEEDWDYVHNVNLKTVYFLCKGRGAGNAEAGQWQDYQHLLGGELPRRISRAGLHRQQGRCGSAD